MANGPLTTADAYEGNYPTMAGKHDGLADVIDVRWTCGDCDASSDAPHHNPYTPGVSAPADLGSERARAIRAATSAVRKLLAQAKNPRTLLHTYSPTGVAYHAARAAIEAYEEAMRESHDNRRPSR